jgi:hypothetical protein
MREREYETPDRDHDRHRDAEHAHHSPKREVRDELVLRVRCRDGLEKRSGRSSSRLGHRILLRWSGPPTAHCGLLRRGGLTHSRGATRCRSSTLQESIEDESREAIEHESMQHAFRNLDDSCAGCRAHTFGAVPAGGTANFASKTLKSDGSRRRRSAPLKQESGDETSASLPERWRAEGGYPANRGIRRPHRLSECPAPDGASGW